MCDNTGTQGGQDQEGQWQRKKQQEEQSMATSIPEEAGGDKNYRYPFCQLRACDQEGQRDELSHQEWGE